MSWLPPYGWWAREKDHKTVLRGWDWMLGACTLMHGLVTLPLSLWLVQSRVLAVALWLLLSLFVAAAVGWSVVIDAQGLLFCRTWMGLPLARKRFPPQTPTTVDVDVYAPDGADFGRFVRLGTGEGCEFGVRYNAKDLKAALDKAVTRHHGSEPT